MIKKKTTQEEIRAIKGRLEMFEAQLRGFIGRLDSIQNGLYGAYEMGIAAEKRKNKKRKK
jgi:hypothetical protein